ncbi:radical SAM/CxCxxxxC motif protein YfkAB [Staphylococcus schleiferi]|uniref:radical SAM/CxCxxxxC motif protein YfkAB n=1 Tax=Staphylococcus schleiferi TaxID=1295 RepID=UPI001888A802|nr:radical SAM/CxCxxxxC motif protein YfkAB [Staphylococcus schleiferi]MBF1992330.1 radical SAM/CxCxxxxC motif protein YfkAB [Staphylococcus schleiferi]MBF2038024.1 radical SAM/CxCxxxxC motif protein YfkAB [Staphylococcus schleiferi]MBF2099828.1 radical SAM/CxCxxxxC motif protein YfkAB [Staphylococcus schleiferi]MBF2102222.1 radical SAM/CxCxxxxC motif protein YfkAB [Staphylococcus schleiferi]MBF2104295.1 radical SAM/CxCxxxxC motif protein YfkAB [Staphylococcus schleiferi]
MISTKKDPITIKNDPWEPYSDINRYGQPVLSNVEFTTTNLCNMRCSHCAVGYTLQTRDPDPLPMSLITQRLDEIPTLRTISITGGEPMFSKKSIREVVKPLLKYAEQRGIYVQLNSNLTLPLDRYLDIAEYIDVLHISHNWGTIDTFTEVGFGAMDKQPPLKAKLKLYEQMISNAQNLSRQGMFVSAETMLNKSTLPYLESIHHEVIHDMKCQRHEVHPMYPADFASQLEVLDLKTMKSAISHLLDVRDKDTWMLFGTLPIFPCLQDEADAQLREKLKQAPNVSTRNDPDGRSRLNVNVFTGNVIVTDFGDETGTISNIKQDRLTDVFQRWMATPLSKSINCHCPQFECLGPNILVKNMYYSNVDFKKQEQRMHQFFS